MCQLTESITRFLSLTLKKTDKLWWVSGENKMGSNSNPKAAISRGGEESRN